MICIDYPWHTNCSYRAKNWPTCFNLNKLKLWSLKDTHGVTRLSLGKVACEISKLALGNFAGRPDSTSAWANLIEEQLANRHSLCFFSFRFILISVGHYDSLKSAWTWIFETSQEVTSPQKGQLCQNLHKSLGFSCPTDQHLVWNPTSKLVNPPSSMSIYKSFTFISFCWATTLQALPIVWCLLGSLRSLPLPGFLRLGPAVCLLALEVLGAGSAWGGGEHVLGRSQMRGPKTTGDNGWK